MRYVKIALTSGAGHVITVAEDAVWLAFPWKTGSRLYLRECMDAAIKPTQVTEKLSPLDGLMLLIQAHMVKQIGSTVEAHCSVEEAALEMGLVTFFARDKDGSYPCAIAPSYVIAVAPAWQDGNLMGSNIFVRGLVMETNSTVIPVIDEPDRVISTLGLVVRPTVIGERAISKVHNASVIQQ